MTDLSDLTIYTLFVCPKCGDWGDQSFVCESDFRAAEPVEVVPLADERLDRHEIMKGSTNRGGTATTARPRTTSEG